MELCKDTNSISKMYEFKMFIISNIKDRIKLFPIPFNIGYNMPDMTNSQVYIYSSSIGLEF